MKTESIQQIKAALATIETRNDERIERWKKDERSGVQQALAQWDRRIQRYEKELALFEEMQEFENNARAQGHRLIVGIDEVGRGPLAGPVVAAAVIFQKGSNCLE